MRLQSFVREAVSLSLAILLLAPIPSFSWGGEGHRLVGDIAEAALAPTPRVMERIRGIFGNSVHLRDLAPCADRIRDFVRDSGRTPVDPECAALVARFSTPQGLLTRFNRSDKWHFINIPIDGGHSMADVRSFCGPDLCAPERIEHYKDVLSANATRAIQAEAVFFLAHLVGDLHQPLHSAMRNKDSGGNLALVRLFGQEFNLHRVWDQELIRRMADDQGRPLRNEEARSRYLQSELPAPGPFNPWEWALEAAGQARTVVYVNHGGAGQIPDDRTVPGASMHDAEYLAKSAPVVRQQLRLAGTRLAAILQEKFNR